MSRIWACHTLHLKYMCTKRSCQFGAFFFVTDPANSNFQSDMLVIPLISRRCKTNLFEKRLHRIILIYLHLGHSKCTSAKL